MRVGTGGPRSPREALLRSLRIYLHQQLFVKRIIIGSGTQCTLRSTGLIKLTVPPETLTERGKTFSFHAKVLLFCFVKTSAMKIVPRKPFQILKRQVEGC